jgi:hypothetical protein
MMRGWVDGWCRWSQWDFSRYGLAAGTTVSRSYHFYEVVSLLPAQLVWKRQKRTVSQAEVFVLVGEGAFVSDVKANHMTWTLPKRKWVGPMP